MATEGGGRSAVDASSGAGDPTSEPPTPALRIASSRAANTVLVPEAPCVVQPRQKELALELLELVIVLITEQPVCWLGSGSRSSGDGGVPAVVRRELLHVLAKGSTSFGALAERAQTVCAFYERGYKVSLFYLPLHSV